MQKFWGIVFIWTQTWGHFPICISVLLIQIVSKMYGHLKTLNLITLKRHRWEYPRPSSCLLCDAYLFVGYLSSALFYSWECKKPLFRVMLTLVTTPTYLHSTSATPIRPKYTSTHPQSPIKMSIRPHPPIIYLHPPQLTHKKCLLTPTHPKYASTHSYSPSRTREKCSLTACLTLPISHWRIKNVPQSHKIYLFTQPFSPYSPIKKLRSPLSNQNISQHNPNHT